MSLKCPESPDEINSDLKQYKSNLLVNLFVCCVMEGYTWIKYFRVLLEHIYEQESKTTEIKLFFLILYKPHDT